MKDDEVFLSDKERSLIDAIAALHGLTRDQATTKLFREGLANRVKKKTGFRPSASVLKFPK